MNRLFVIWDRIGDYHRARLKALGGLVGMDNLIAADLGGVDKLYAWENSTNTPYQHVQLSNKPVEKSDAFHRLRNFLRILNQTKIKMVCLSGYGRLEYLLFIIISRLYGKKVLIFAESWYGNNKVVNYVKGQFLKTFVHYFFVSGSRARNHFHQKLGIPLSRIRTGYSVVDNNHFSPHNPTTQPLNPSSTPQQLNPLNSLNPLNPLNPLNSLNPLNNPPINILLTVARYSPEKNIPFLINAYRKSDLYKKWKLVIIGDGPDRSLLEKQIQGDEECIQLTGWKSYSELPRWYQQASAFILASTFEPWGLVVNEALAAGLPVIASRECGCVPELIKDNGWVFDPNNSNDLINILNTLSDQKNGEPEKRGLRGKVIIEDYSPETWAKTIINFNS